jgi:hypothetical protein
MRLAGHVALLCFLAVPLPLPFRSLRSYTWFPSALSGHTLGSLPLPPVIHLAPFRSLRSYTWFPSALSLAKQLNCKGRFLVPSNAPLCSRLLVYANPMLITKTGIAEPVSIYFAP